jgi:cysteine desulfurase
MFWKNKRIYLDYAAATPILPEATHAHQGALAVFGNPNGLHKEGVSAKASLESAREKIALGLQCRARELIFTSGGTECNNLAIFGSIIKPSEAHIITSAIEHPSILEPILELERRGAQVTHLAVDSCGHISPENVSKALTPQTSLVSIGWANGEIGVVQSISAISKIIREYEKAQKTKIIFHTDVGQAPLYIKSTMHSLDVDLATLDSGKLYGPRGIGALFIKNGISIAPLFLGGGQERGIRSGTENVALAIGFATAFETFFRERENESNRLTNLRAQFLTEIEHAIPNAVVNGESAKNILPHIVNISIPDIDAEYVALALDHRGIAISTKTSCKEGERESSVVKALNMESWRAHSTLRFSFGRMTTEKDIKRIVPVLAEIITACRKLAQN